MAAGPYSDETVWTVDPTKLIIDMREDVFLVFHRDSGDTHILNFLSAGIYEVLESDGPANFEAIAARIWGKMELTPEDCPQDLIVKTILELDDVAIVYPLHQEPSS